MRYTTRPVLVHAEQWLATPESLVLIQALLSPSSPLWSPDSKLLGVMVTTDQAYIPTALQHIDCGGWVIVDPETRRVSIMKDDEFQRRYVQPVVEFHYSTDESVQV